MRVNTSLFFNKTLERGVEDDNVLNSRGKPWSLPVPRPHCWAMPSSSNSSYGIGDMRMNLFEKRGYHFPVAQEKTQPGIILPKSFLETQNSLFHWRKCLPSFAQFCDQVHVLVLQCRNVRVDVLKRQKMTRIFLKKRKNYKETDRQRFIVRWGGLWSTHCDILCRRKTAGTRNWFAFVHFNSKQFFGRQSPLWKLSLGGHWFSHPNYNCWSQC